MTKKTTISIKLDIELASFPTPAAWYEWRTAFFKGSHPSQRLGQAFCNTFNINDPALFFSKDLGYAEKVITENYLLPVKEN